MENEVWRRISEIIDDPNRLMSVISDTIENLRLKEADLSARIRPIDERLSEIAWQKEKLADEWVIRNMNSDKFKDLKDNLDKEEARIRALGSELIRLKSRNWRAPKVFYASGKIKSGRWPEISRMKTAACFGRWMGLTRWR